MAELPKHPSESFKKRNAHLYDKGDMDDPLPPGEASETNLVIQKSTDEDRLNKLEKAWLFQLRLTYPADRIGVQSITLKLGDDCRYVPDFWTIDANGQLEFWETKGFRRRLGQAKIAIAARTFRWARFTLVEKIKGQWVETKVKP